MEEEMVIQHEAIRSDTYKLLAECYYPPDETLSGKITDLCEKIGIVCPRARQDIDWCGEEIPEPDNVEKLMVEHARLFMGPYTLPAPPYGSVYLDSGNRVMGNSTMDVISRYREAGLVLAEDFKDAPDHIAVELEFMHFLICTTIEAITKNDIGAVFASVQKQQSFLEDHLCVWFAEFSDNIAQHAQSPFYKNLAMTTQTFLEEDYKLISTAVSSERQETEKYGGINSLRA